jgi:hypothetical protein
MKVRKIKPRRPVILRSLDDVRVYRGSADTLWVRGHCSGKFVRDTFPLEADNGGAVIVLPQAATKGGE